MKAIRRLIAEEWWAAVLALIVLIGGLAAVFFTELLPAKEPTFKDPNVLDVLLGSRLAVGVVRLVALAICLFIIASLVVRAWHGQWLKSGLGMEVEDAQQIADDRAELASRLESAAARIAELEAVVEDFLQEQPDLTEEEEDTWTPPSEEPTVDLTESSE